MALWCFAVFLFNYKEYIKDKYTDKVIFVPDGVINIKEVKQPIRVYRASAEIYLKPQDYREEKYPHLIDLRKERTIEDLKNMFLKDIKDKISVRTVQNLSRPPYYQTIEVSIEIVEPSAGV